MPYALSISWSITPDIKTMVVSHIIDKMSGFLSDFIFPPRENDRIAIRTNG